MSDVKVIRITSISEKFESPKLTDETAAALEEVEMMKKDPHFGKRYVNIREIFDELLRQYSK